MTQPPHDVLAAEAFVVPGPDPELHPHGPVQLPEDPSGIAEPHDVLAAEEFAMPAPRAGGGRLLGASQSIAGQQLRILLVAAGVVAALRLFGVLRRWRREL